MRGHFRYTMKYITILKFKLFRPLNTPKVCLESEQKIRRASAKMPSRDIQMAPLGLEKRYGTAVEHGLSIALFGWAKSPGWADSCWSSRTAYSAIRTSSIFCQHLCHLADPSSRYSKNQQVLCRLEQAQPSQPFLGHPNRLYFVSASNMA